MRTSFSNPRSLITALLVLFVLFSCSRDKNKYPIVPFLRIDGVNVYNNGAGKDSFILLELYFTDGDGDIGLKPQDSFPPFGNGEEFFYNLKIWMLEKKGGIWSKLMNPFSPTDTLNFHERLLPITPTGRYKWIEGHMEVRIPAEPYTAKPDTVKLQAQLLDRGLHKSQLQETDEFVLRH